jgi:pteridine reductase
MSCTKEKIALVTGAARRIGAQIAHSMHQAGYRLIIHYHHSENEALKLKAELNTQRAHSAEILAADLNHIESLSNFISTASEIWGGLDVLVNNASSFFPTALGSTTLEQWDDLINTNLKAPFFLAQAAAKILKERQGNIINIADIHGQRPLKNYPVYSIAKAGLIMLTQSLAREMAPLVRVNAIAPGATLLPAGYPPESEVYLKERTVLNRFVDPAEIGAAVLFFLQQTSITGQILNIDCGRSLRQ